ncbi:MAG: hypothetical protein QOG79_3044 [Mycobacterium sp.]|jgi:hypothetical protein|nr:hypothetical protein [Mycobacterium sp.]MDT5238062.1 hypothetical protein [Mycobacterium sp.]MDT5287461.1 hypothetical protein [Mycobacterium sp.]MDT5299802.1 hypothetical protein [Mycobacterium sp.]MDT5358250.1 hypothetical protein [Mycobacterium sp.]
MEQGERALLAGVPEVGYATGPVRGWDGLRQSAVGYSMGRDAATVTHVRETKPGWIATILAELTR